MDIFAMMVAKLRRIVRAGAESPAPAAAQAARLRVYDPDAYRVCAAAVPCPEYPGEYGRYAKLDGSNRLARAMASAAGWSLRGDEIARRVGFDPDAVLIVEWDGTVVATVRVEQPVPAGGAA